MKKLSAFLAMVLCVALSAFAVAEAPQYASAKNFVGALESHAMVFAFAGRTEKGEEQISVTCENEASSRDLHILFDADEVLVTVRAEKVIVFDMADEAAVLKTVNMLNASYMYVRFYVTEDASVTCEMCLVLHDVSGAGENVLAGIERMNSILEEAEILLSPYAR